MANYKKIGEDITKAASYIYNPVSYVKDSSVWAAKNLAKTEPGKKVIGAVAKRYDIPLEGKTSVSTAGGGGGGRAFGDEPTLSDLLAADAKAISSSGGSGGGYSYTPQKADISGVIAAYQQRAATDTDTVNKTYENTRSDLLTSLKRFQEENAQNVENQRKAYLSGQAALDSARFEADRQNRISAAARGLGGSGLQQLSQLQNLISQGQDISDLNAQNQSKLDTLRRALAQQEEDTNTALARAEQARDTSLRNISDTLASSIAQAELEAENNYINALNSARAAAASARSGASSNNAAANAAMNSFIQELYGAQTKQEEGNNEVLNSIKRRLFEGDTKLSKKELNNITNKSLLNAYARNLTETYGTDLTGYLKKYGSWFTG